MYAQTTSGIITGGGGGAPYDPKTTLVIAADDTFAMPAKLLSHITIKPAGADAAISIGTTPAGTELVNAELCTGGVANDFSIGKKFDAAATLYITGITSSTTFTFYNF